MTKLISPEFAYVAAVVGVAYATGSFFVLVLLCLLLLRTPANAGEGEQQ